MLMCSGAGSPYILQHNVLDLAYDKIQLTCGMYGVSVDQVGEASRRELLQIATLSRVRH